METQITTDQMYRFTTDLGQAGATVALGYPVDHFARDKDSPEKIIFAFKREAGLDKVMEGYWTNTITLKPYKFYECLKMLKTRIKQEVYNKQSKNK